jgi:hypothetical protein
MNRIQYIRRFAVTVAGLASALVAFAAAAPAALASGGPVPIPPPIREKHPPLPPPGHVVGPVLNPNRAGYPSISHVHTVVIGGMPGWQITLIALGAALAAAVVAVLFDRARAARRHVTAAAA